MLPDTPEYIMSHMCPIIQHGFIIKNILPYIIKIRTIDVFEAGCIIAFIPTPLISVYWNL